MQRELKQWDATFLKVFPRLRSQANLLLTQALEPKIPRKEDDNDDSDNLQHVLIEEHANDLLGVEDAKWADASELFKVCACCASCARVCVCVSPVVLGAGDLCIRAWVRHRDDG